MIIQSESGLTVEQYNALAAAHLSNDSSATYKLIAHQYNLDFDQTRNVDYNSGTDFDVIDTEDFFVRVYSDGIIEYSGKGSSNWYEMDSGSPGSWNSYPMGLSLDTTSENAFYVWAACTDGLYRRRVTFSQVDGWQPGSWSLFLSQSNITFIAPINDRCHYVYRDATKGISNLRCFHDGVSVDSDIWWTSDITGFDAVEHNGEDVIIAVAGTPGLTALKVEGTAVMKMVYASGGLVAFKYKYKSWGDHIEVDIVEKETSYRYRKRVKASVINDRIVAIAYTGEGDELYNLTGYRMYTSKDGRFWSRGEYIELPGESSSYGAKLLAHEDYVYAFERRNVWRSPSTLQIGYSSPLIQVDVTSFVIEYDIQHDGMLQSSVVLDNSLHWLDNHPIINRDNSLVFTHHLGYWLVPSGGTVGTYDDGHTYDGGYVYGGSSILAPVQALVLVGVTEVDTMGHEIGLPEDYVKFSGRDALGRMSDRSQAEQPRYWQTQLIGSDNYRNNTNTNYGGLRHTASQGGSWGTVGETLQLFSSNSEGVAFSTFSPYVWNGGIQVEFNLSKKHNSEFAGVVFRATDKDNAWLVKYNQANDRLELIERRNGADSIKAQSTVLGWSNDPIASRYVNVKFRYARVNVYTSSDNATWSKVISYLMDGVYALDFFPQTRISRQERGFVGVIGRGYTPPNYWKTVLPGTAPTTGVPIPSGIENEWEHRIAIENFAVTWNDAGKIARTPNFTQPGTEWDDFSPPGYLIKDAVFDWGSEFIESDYEGGALGIYAVATNAANDRLYLLYCDDAVALNPTWEIRFTKVIDRVGTYINFSGKARIASSKLPTEFIAIAFASDRNVHLLRSTNSGNSFSETTVGTTNPDGASSNDNEIGLDINNGVLFVTGRRASQEWTVYFSLVADGPLSTPATFVKAPSSFPAIDISSSNYIYAVAPQNGQLNTDEIYELRFNNLEDSYDGYEIESTPDYGITSDLTPGVPNAYYNAIHIGVDATSQATVYTGEMYMRFRVNFPHASSPYYYPLPTWYVTDQNTAQPHTWEFTLTWYEYGTDNVLFTHTESYDMSYQIPSIAADFNPTYSTNVGAIEWEIRVRNTAGGDTVVLNIPFGDVYRIGFETARVKCDPRLWGDYTIWRLSNYTTDSPTWENITPSLGTAPRLPFGIRVDTQNNANISMAGTNENDEIRRKGLSTDYGSYISEDLDQDGIDGLLRHGNRLALWGGGYVWYSQDYGRSLGDRRGNLASQWGSIGTIRGVLTLE